SPLHQTTTPYLCELREVDARTIWPNEEYNFTPWLAENISRLSRVIGIDIEVLEVERRIGTYELDIYAIDRTNNVIVIIENQLTESDHGHLGQLITYAAGLDAKVIVWIATRVRDEHRAAV